MKRKRLGLPPKEHADRASEVFSRAERQAAQAKSAVAHGQCGRALDAITEAYSLLGTAEAHVSSTGELRRDPVTGFRDDVIRLRRVDETLESAREDFIDRCVRRSDDEVDEEEETRRVLWSTAGFSGRSRRKW